jgi:hypothetical protein
MVFFPFQFAVSVERRGKSDDNAFRAHCGGKEPQPAATDALNERADRRPNWPELDGKEA